MNVRTVSLKVWLQVSVLIFGILLYAVSTLMSWSSEKKEIVRNSTEFVRYDMSQLARELNTLILAENFYESENRLRLFNVNTRYKVVFIARVPSGNKWLSSSIVQTAKPYEKLSERDQEIVAGFVYSSKARFDYNPDTKTISGYFSVPTDNWSSTQLRDGVLIGRFNIANDQQKMFDRILQQSYISGAIISLFVISLLFFYRYLIQQPIDSLINAIEKFSHQRSPIKLGNLRSREVGNLGKALEIMSIDVIEQWTQKKIAEGKVKRSSLVLESIFDAIPDLFFLVNKELTINDYRAQKTSLYLPPEQFLGKRMNDVLPDDVGQLFKENFDQLFAGKSFVTFEYRLPNLAGNIRFFEARACRVPESDEAIVIVRDVTERKESEETISRQAFYDSLTNLPNRYLAQDRLNQAIVEAKRNQHQVAVIFLDLDDFKKINDTLGHLKGDEVLSAAAQRLSHEVRSSDTVARLGGDEFLILLSELENIIPVQTIVSAVQASLSKPFEFDQQEIQISTSIGIAMYPQDDVDAQELLRKADMAMYNAKALGKDQSSFFTETMNEQMARRLNLELHLRNALANDEFEVYYQPQFDLTHKRIIGAEALLRWTNPVIGSISPAEFIPIAEQSGYINDIGHFVLQQAIAQCAQWQPIFGSEFQISVNISPRQMRDTNLVPFIKQTLNHHQVNGTQLDLEITEGVLLSNPETVRAVLCEVQALGISLSMDDFGTGYSSLSYLLQYPFQTVKVDRSFIQAMSKNHHSKELVRAIISLAHSLGLSVVAEGVETTDDAQRLKGYQCDKIQGFLMGKAAPAQTFIDIWADEQTPKTLLGEF